MRLISTDQQPELPRGSAVVCLTALAEHAETLAGVRGVAQHCDRLTPVLVVGPAACVERAAEDLAEETLDEALLGLVTEAGNEVAVVNAAIRASFPGDFVLVGPGVRVAEGWLEGLRRAARSDSIVASATPLSLGGGGLDVFTENGAPDTGSSGGERPDPHVDRMGADEPGRTLNRAAERVASRALGLHPRIAIIGDGCAYVRRAALELAGPLDESLALSDALAGLAIRLTALGMVNVLADDVLVQGEVLGPEAVESDPAPARAGDAIRETVMNDEQGPLHRAKSRARMALRGLSVTIDGRALTSRAGGTQTYIIELVLALARDSEVSVRVLVPPDLSERATEALTSAPDVELLTYEQAIDQPRLTDVVHRPQQVFTPDDLALLGLVGERIVIGHQDLIAYHNQSYHRDVDTWRAYRRTTRLALARADQAIFFSEHARRDALAEDLLPERRTHVVGLGAETLEPLDRQESRPQGLKVDEEFLLCLGADYAHKNRPFAIELLGALREQGWVGRLVLAGAHVPHGSSREREQEVLAGSPDLAGLIVDLGPVDEPSRQWLYAHARALVYPTLYEGFGLLPLEAARADLPCLFAAQASLSELAGGAATLIPWDARASAAAVLPLLSAGPARDRHLAQLRALSIPPWSVVVDQLVAVYEKAFTDPPSDAAPRVWQELARESHIVRLDQDVSKLKETAQDYQDAYHELEARVSTGLPLIDAGGLLSPEQQRGLMRVAARPWLGAVALKPFGVLGGLGGGSSSGSNRAEDGQGAPGGDA